VSSDGADWAERAWVRIAALAAVLTLSAFNLLWRLDRADWHFDEPNYRRVGWDAVHFRTPAPGSPPPVGQLVIGISQELFGRGAVGVRLLPALFSWTVTLAVFLLGRRISGWWAGVVAAALWAALPRALVVAGETTGVVRADRYGLLDTVAFATVAWGLFAAFAWIDRPSIRRAAGTGVVLGLALAAKLSTAPALLAVGLVALIAIRPLAVSLRQVGTLAATAAAAFLLTYLPFGTDWDMPRSMVTWQLDHASVGHTTVIAGTVWTKEPWWANASNWLTGMGGVVALTLLALCLASWCGRDRLGVALLWVVLLATVIALAAGPIALVHYWTAWVVPMLVLAGVGLCAMFRQGGWMRGAGAVAALILLCSGLLATAQIATMQRGDYARMAAEVRARGVPPEIALSLGTRLDIYFPDVQSTYATLAGRDVAMDLLVIEDQFAAAARPDVIARLRREAGENGLSPHRVGHLEYWYRLR
jgi:4-amino-4-deoxy-L-arabinose transferase-like glycosyltransferase